VRRVLFISAGAVGTAMAGVSIRAYELARALQPHAEVTLAGIHSDLDPLSDLRQVTYDPRNPRELIPEIEAADAIFTAPVFPVLVPALRRARARVIFDLLTPEPFENLEYLADASPLRRRAMLTLVIDRVAEALHAGHHAVCAGEKQRDLWIGTMLAERLITPTRYDADPSLRETLDLVPFGVPAEAPVLTGPGARAAFGLGDEDEILLWSGGIWSWLDAPTAIRAVAELHRRRPSVRLVFMAASDAGPALVAAEEARRLAGELGLLDSVVYFNREWVPYAERANWLLEADCNFSMHREHLETRFAFRTRVLDCFWSGLPIVATEGDELADRVERDDLGAAVPAGDAEAAAAALERVLERGRDSYAAGLARAAEEHAWPRVAEPLVRWIESDSLPPRIGAGVTRRPAHAVRTRAYAAAAGARNALGLERWVRL
jgi:glycosyltransferase involved in cell wall biosynthesis